MRQLSQILTTVFGLAASCARAFNPPVFHPTCHKTLFVRVPPQSVSRLGDDEDASPSTPPRLTPNEEQAKLMKSLGYRWNPQRNSWTRGNPKRRTLECRSGGRVLRLIGDDCPLPVTEATKHLEHVLVKAREEALREEGVQGSALPTFVDKNALSSPLAPSLWFGLQTATLMTILTKFHPELGFDLTSSPGTAFVSLAAGLAASPIISALRRARWDFQVGYEDLDGAVERVLVDSALGSHALPAPWEWRASNKDWRQLTVGAETVASLNMMLFVHGLVQADLTKIYAHNIGSDILGAGYALVVLVFLSAAVASSTVRAPFDGVDAEISAVRRAERTANVFFSFKSDESGPDAVAESTHKAEIFKVLAQEWIMKFDRAAKGGESSNLLAATLSAATFLSNGVNQMMGYEGKNMYSAAAFAVPLLAGMMALTTGALWMITGGVTAPIVACTMANYYLYVESPDPDLSRVSIPLESLPEKPVIQ